ncbi:RagB/SusD family nutrient uptake outer membrane protein [uncultured Draconibacterium sp.]|uniref:RagB/SusD family nutrient uptake outer membrane protein n=1 Tax=uncultured Draconibacterium sp. TaxID=1573823 RepID=UPI0029C647F6|nr:RagB/SusD family nutrient uptake outer membrane protein [uncultured Draconibacterium sp.]
MNTNYKKYLILFVGIISILVSSCISDLDTLPRDKDELTSDKVYQDPDYYKQVLSKLYAGLALSGQSGPSGSNDLSGLDEGFGQYLRALWYAQELPTDEVIIAWNDGNLRDFHDIEWTPSNEFITNLYYRILYQVTLCNEFLRETTDEKLNGRDFEDSVKEEIKSFRSEARFLRALSYYHAIDLFGSIPFVTEEDEVGAFFPQQISRKDLFDFVEKELKEIEPLITTAGQAEYGRADQSAVWMVLSKMYLNAEVYIDEAKYSECAEYSQKIIDVGYGLEDNYENLFLADNHLSEGVIFPINYDGIQSRSYGGTDFIIHACIGNTLEPTTLGVDGGWAGIRTTKEMVAKFKDLSLIKSATISNKSAAVYPVVYLPGNYQSASGYSEFDWSFDNVPTLASVNSDSNYEGYIYFADDNSQFKITETPDWNAGWGSADGVLSNDGDNLIASEAGYYKINVDMGSDPKTYSVQKVDWGIIGSATEGQWDVSQSMNFDPETKIWSAQIDLVPGDIKFIANNDWGIALGVDAFTGGLSYWGDNISIADAGTYSIELDVNSPDFTFSIVRSSFDRREMFYTEDQTLEIDDIFEFSQGYLVIKWKNITSAGEMGSDASFVDTDFPFFRVAEAYMNYAEAVLRGAANGNLATALEYVNRIRTRAYTDNSGNISSEDLTLDFILDERAREFYWEGHRRTDLIRFGKFVGNDYLWAWKGGVKEGKAVNERYRLYPIPASEMTANINLTQTPGY